MLINLSHLIIFYSFITVLSLNNISVTPPPKKTLQILIYCGEIEFPSYPGSGFSNCDLTVSW